MRGVFSGRENVSSGIKNTKSIVLIYKNSRYLLYFHECSGSRFNHLPTVKSNGFAFLERNRWKYHMSQ